MHHDPNVKGHATLEMVGEGKVHKEENKITTKQTPEQREEQ